MYIITKAAKIGGCRESLSFLFEMAQTPRINADHLTSGQFNGHIVRAVGKLVGMDNGNVQIELVGAQGARPILRPTPPQPHPSALCVPCQPVRRSCALSL